jgi:hypothetical protein
MVAQGGVRSLAPPAPRGQMMLLGEDSLGIAAAAWTKQIDGAHDVFVAVIAVALRLRHGSRYYGDELLTEVQDRLVSDAIAADKSELTISGHVDPKNEASKALLNRFHWQTFDHAGRYERWLTYIPLPGSGA